MTVTGQLATAFGIGRVRYAPGTVASIAALAIAVPVEHLLGWFAVVVLALATAIAGIWASEAYALERGINDPGDCVIDEFAGQWLACGVAGLGANLNGEHMGAIGYVLAFVVFRLFDVAKPWPISSAERLKGGFGIVADDIVAGLFAGLFVFLIEQSGFM